MKILLDIDGVLANFADAVIEWYDLPIKHSEVCDWGKLLEVSGMGKSGFWEGLGDEFWMTLKLYPWAHKVLRLLDGYDIALLTAPATGQASGKQLWIKKHLNRFFFEKRYFIGPGKEFFASPNMLLIDDSDRNIRKFREHEGIAITFAQPWNKLANYSDDPFSRFEYDFKILIDMMPF
jgi:5'(3')-deoxyribonucleotidase